MGSVDDSLLHEARARVLADLTARQQATACAVTALDEACTSRRWWAEQWPAGADYVAGLVAQDVQDALLAEVGRWPLCLDCGDAPTHSLYIQPDLGGPDPVWVCEESGEVAAPLGYLSRLARSRGAARSISQAEPDPTPREDNRRERERQRAERSSAISQPPRRSSERRAVCTTEWSERSERTREEDGVSARRAELGHQSAPSWIHIV